MRKEFGGKGTILSKDRQVEPYRPTRARPLGARHFGFRGGGTIPGMAVQDSAAVTSKRPGVPRNLAKMADTLVLEGWRHEGHQRV